MSSCLTEDTEKKNRNFEDTKPVLTDPLHLG